MDEVDDAAQLIRSTPDGKIRTIQTDEDMNDILREAERHASKIPQMPKWPLVKATYHSIKSMERLKREAPEYWNEVMA